MARRAAGHGGEALPGGITHDIAELYAQYHGSLVRLLVRRTGDPDRAEDIVQEVFVRALEAPPNNPRPWLFAVALNLARDNGRAAVRQGRKLELLKGEHAEDVAPPPDEAVERDERIATVR